MNPKVRCHKYKLIVFAALIRHITHFPSLLPRMIFCIPGDKLHKRGQELPPRSKVQSVYNEMFSSRMFLMKHITVVLWIKIFQKVRAFDRLFWGLNRVQTEQAVEGSSLIENIFCHKTLLALFYYGLFWQYLLVVVPLFFSCIINVYSCFIVIIKAPKTLL